MNPAYRERIRSTAFHLMIRWASPTIMSIFASLMQAGWNVDRLDEEHVVRDVVSELVLAQEELHRDVLFWRVAAERQ